ncbi:MAG: hypothetical protein HY874_01435 [Chloroflexi bacterium]|nr:hypothetical protein [Chloroflexota bacterium]
MPKQNRPLVRDGRIQAKKKRTDRSYLRPEAAPAETVAEEELPDEEPQDASAIVRAAVSAAEPSMPEPTAAFEPPPAAPVPFRRTPSGKLPTAVRAIQQQGVRKRREFDVQALAVRDTKYAVHELRRIAVLASMVVITLIVLALVLR